MTDETDKAILRRVDDAFLADLGYLQCEVDNWLSSIFPKDHPMYLGARLAMDSMDNFAVVHYWANKNRTS